MNGVTASVPPNRIGGRLGRSREDSERLIWEWIESQKAAIKDRIQSLSRENTDLSLFDTLKNVRGLIAQYYNVRGTHGSPERIIHEIERLVAPYVDSAVVVELREEMTRSLASRPATDWIGEDSDPEMARLVELLQYQRTDTGSFCDDGRLQARRLAGYLKRHDLLSDHRVLELAELASEMSDERLTEESLSAFLDDYRYEIESLLDRVSGPQLPIHNPSLAADSEMERVLDRIHAELAAEVSDGVDAAVLALLDFLEEISSPDSVRKLVEKYSTVVAATCQQSVSLGAYSDRVYDYVIVDEAARANPLDLLIPMSLGRRIILVGDHKQLPHVLDEDVLESYRKRKDSEALGFLSESLFERLFVRFQQAQDNGGPQRVVTLTDDFRMHPSISRFVSHTFYDGMVQSRVDPAPASHGLPMYDGKALVWIDLPLDRGPESVEVSKRRRVEATEIMLEIEKILKMDNTYKIGVISFYQAQARMLSEMVGELPLDWQSRIRVGTVDSFQGLEFDITFLSAVRSNTIRDDLRRRVGFLSSENRMCVALSRARRLLVVVGDADTVAGTAEQPAVTSLRELLRLCKTEEGFYERR